MHTGSNIPKPSYEHITNVEKLKIQHFLQQHTHRFRFT